MQVNAVCYGAKVLLPGVLRFDVGIEPAMETVVMTTKGEAVALGLSVSSFSAPLVRSLCAHIPLCLSMLFSPRPLGLSLIVAMGNLFAYHSHESHPSPYKPPLLRQQSP